MANSSFLELKKTRNSQLDKLSQELTKLQSTQGPNNANNDADLYWQPTVDKAGNGYAVIRFLPAPKGEDVPFVRIFSHAFKGPTGSWYIENSLTTLGQKDPVGEANSKLWNSGIESDKAIARAQKRKLTFISNIQVIKDPGNPENEGKVFYFKYGKKIFDKLNDLMNPQYEDENRVNPFDLWEGANFKLKIRQVEGYRNYDKSEFEQPGPLSDDDDELEKIWSSERSLQTFLDPKNFKSWDDLKSRLDRVNGLSGAVANTEPTLDSVAGKTKPAKSLPTSAEDEEEDDIDELFKKLASDD